MSLTYTPNGNLGSSLPAFELKSVDGKNYSHLDFKGQALVVMFICNHCPYVKAIEDRLINLAQQFKNQAVQFVAVCSNDPQEYEEDSLEQLLKRSREKKYPFPYLHDLSQKVAKDFGAVCTPDLFLYDQSARLAYRGRLDDSWKDASKVTRHELQQAIQAILSDQAVTTTQFPAMGCSIKWL